MRRSRCQHCLVCFVFEGILWVYPLLITDRKPAHTRPSGTPGQQAAKQSAMAGNKSCPGHPSHTQKCSTPLAYPRRQTRP